MMKEEMRLKVVEESVRLKKDDSRKPMLRSWNLTLRLGHLQISSSGFSFVNLIIQSQPNKSFEDYREPIASSRQRDAPTPNRPRTPSTSKKLPSLPCRATTWNWKDKLMFLRK